MPEAENVTVAVRVRPFNKREESRNAINCISMDGKVTSIRNPKNPDEFKQFTFDYSYWSFDGHVENEDGYVLPDPKSRNGSKYADQEKVFSDLGDTILKNAWNGYNSTMFAYGQTGSGKSWSVIGFTPNDGIVPLFCAKLFQQIEEKRASGGKTEYEVEFSMLEIYNEVVRDLCNPNSNPKKGLKVRENPNKGFYADGLKSTPVANYEMISKKMESGKLNRTIHSTNMNTNSSRAHTIVGITFRQKQKNEQGAQIEKSAIINLVDLAGSERVCKTGASGDTLKEGAAINQSLSALGNCIHALAEGGKTKVPYRDSVLTKLLRNALGGNSKTIMIAAISPADINYEESLTTLRYADRAKQIKTVAIVNEDQTEKQIRELKEENQRLKVLLEGGIIDAHMLGDEGEKLDSKALRQKYDEELLRNDNKLAELRTSYEEKLKLARIDMALTSVDQLEEQKQKKIHLYNLNIDAQLTGKLVHFISVGTATIGNKKGKPSDIVLSGPSMQEEHAIINCTNEGEVYLEPATPDAKILHNGDSLTRKIALNTNDRILFGATQLYVFCNPQQKDQGELQTHQTITYAMAQEEIASKNGVLVGDCAQGLDNAAVQEDLLEVMPAVQEANCISSDLDKRVKFEIFLKHSQMCDNVNKSEVCVKMRNLETGQEFVWPKEKFMNRLYLMKEMYNNYEDDDEPWQLPEDEDPFQESPDTEVHIGCCQVFLQPLAFLVELKEQFEITDYKGNEVGLLNMEIIPCNENGIEYTEQDDMFVDSPQELRGRNIFYILKIHSARGISNRYTDICCKYRFFLDKEDTATKAVSDTTTPKFGHVRKLAFQPANDEVVHYLSESFVMVNVWGKQKPRKSAMLFSRGKSTRELLRNDHEIMVRTNIIGSFNINGRIVDPQKQSIIVELLLMKKQQCRLQQRMDYMRRLVERANKFGRKSVPTSIIREVLNAANSQSAEKALAQLEVYNEDDDDEYDSSDDECCHNQKSNANSSFCSLL